MMRVGFVAVFSMALGACAGGDSAALLADADVRILAVGDSVLEFNGDESIPAVLGERLRERGIDAAVDNRAVGGACLAETCGDEPIPDTYTDEGWDFVLVSGGGNDIGVDDDVCGPIDGLVSADLGQGIMVDLIDEITADGAHAVIYGYVHTFTEGWGIDGCAEFHDLMSRYQELASNRDDVTFVDANAVAGRTRAEYYADEVHPSPQGSAVIGTHFADVVASLIS
jgi:acyl-CoA thioesterase I